MKTSEIADVTELQDKACDVLRAQAEEYAKTKSKDALMIAKTVIAAAVAEKMSAFVMQDDTGELARNVVKKDKSLIGCVNEIMKGVTRDTGAMSDLDAYMRAIRYYLPEASVRCSFRCVIPQEVDDDLAFLDVMDEPETGGAAQIIDFFVGGDEA